MAKGKLPKVLARQHVDQKVSDGPTHFESSEYLGKNLKGVIRAPHAVKKKAGGGNPIPSPKSQPHPGV